MNGASFQNLYQRRKDKEPCNSYRKTMKLVYTQLDWENCQIGDLL